MRLRSLLFAPADRPARFDKAVGSGADAVILDLEDSVAPEAKMRAREYVYVWLGRGEALPHFVRINPLSAGMVAEDMACAARATGIVLPKCAGAADVLALAPHLAPGQVVLPIATETPAALFALGTYAQVAEHLAGLTWGAEDLSAAVGATTAREADGRYTAPYELARSLALFAAHAAGVEAIDTVYPAIRDADGLAAYAARAARDGFTGMLALHPDQVPVINATFTPGEDALEHARAVVAAFAEQPGAGVLVVDGRMVDAPHLAQARRLLARAGEG